MAFKSYYIMGIINARGLILFETPLTISQSRNILFEELQIPIRNPPASRASPHLRATIADGFGVPASQVDPKKQAADASKLARTALFFRLYFE